MHQYVSGNKSINNCNWKISRISQCIALWQFKKCMRISIFYSNAHIWKNCTCMKSIQAWYVSIHFDTWLNFNIIWMQKEWIYKTFESIQLKIISSVWWFQIKIIWDVRHYSISVVRPIVGRRIFSTVDFLKLPLTFSR